MVFAAGAEGAIELGNACGCWVTTVERYLVSATGLEKEVQEKCLGRAPPRTTQAKPLGAPKGGMNGTDRSAA
eukprot:5454701-Pyramimonas_sp.AAC.1